MDSTVSFFFFEFVETEYCEIGHKSHYMKTS